MTGKAEIKPDNYSTVRMPTQLLAEIDAIVARHVRGYMSRSEFIKEAIRLRLEQVEASLSTSQI